MARAWLRIASIGVWTMLVVLLRIVTLPLRWVSAGFEVRCRRAVFRLYGRGLMRIIGMQVSVQGRPPEPPYLLVANHLAAIDIFVLASVLGPIFISQGDVARWPLLGLIARSMNTIFIDRSRLKEVTRVNRLITDRLEAGDGIAFFPESTTSPDGQVQPFKTALFEPAVRLGLAVHYASLAYRTPDGGPSALEAILWRDPQSLLDHVLSVASLPSSSVLVVFGAEPVAADDRKMLAEALRNRVRENLPPMA